MPRYLLGSFSINKEYVNHQHSEAGGEGRRAYFWWKFENGDRLLTITKLHFNNNFVTALACMGW